MTKIIAAFDDLEEAQAAAKRLAATGVAQNQISIICNDGKPSRAQSELKKSLAWGGALGAGLALLIPHGGVFYLAGRLARSAALHLLSVTFNLLKIGESGYFNLPEWKPAGDRGKKVRAGVNQARKAGIVIERYDPLSNRDERTRAEIEELCQAWIDTREVDALGWLLELDPFKLAEYKRYFLARAANGHLEGMLACCPIPSRNGWYLEDLIRRPGASRGVSELLIVETLRSLAAEGAELATLATSPLAGVESNGSSGEFKHLARLLRLIYEHLDAFYHFKALHRFKAKFAPSFVEHEYVAIYPPRIRLRMVLGVIGAFDPGGLTNVMASKLRRLWRETRQTKSPVESPE